MNPIPSSAPSTPTDDASLGAASSANVQRFGKYLLLDRVSVGGMAEVFKAQAAGGESGAPVIAIKRILPSLAEDADFIRMFVDEARIAGQLHHDHIARIHELGQVGDAHFIAMEFVWGKDVLQVQNRFRRLRQTMPAPMAAFIAANICAALDYAHRKKGADGNALGIIHRDVSPQNVLVGYRGEVKVIDFGIAKAASRSTKTQAGVLKGKFGYLSPEQVEGLPIDRRSDLFAIGTVLYEMLLADRLFIADSDYATLEKVRKAEVPPPSQAVPGCPPELERILVKALARDVEQRYQWASEMEAELRAYLSSLPEPCGARDLATWMQAHFSAEMGREQAALDEALRAVEELRRAPKTSTEPPSSPTPPATLAVVDTPAPSPVPSEAAPATKDEPGGKPLTDQATHIATAAVTWAASSGAAAAGGLTSELSSESTRLFEAPLPEPPSATSTPKPKPVDEPAQMPAQATQVLDLRTLHPQIAATLAPPAAQAPVPAPSPTPQAAPHVEATTIYHPRLLTDLVLGIAAAAVVLAGVAGARWWMDQRAQRGTLVVVPSPPTTARVLLDGTVRGRIEPGGSLTLRDVPLGAHEVEVLGETDSHVEHVSLRRGDVTVLVPQLKPPTPPAPEAATAPPLTQPTNDAPPAAPTAPATQATETATTNAPSTDGTTAPSPTNEAAGAPAAGPADNDEPTVADGVAASTSRKRPRKHAPPTTKPSSVVEQPATTAAAPGYLVANTQPWAEVYVDGRDTGRSTPIAPSARLPLRPGKHVITFVIGSKKHDFPVEVKSGDEVRLIKTLH